MGKKLCVALIVASTLLAGFLIFNFLSVHNAMKYLSVQYQVTELQKKYNSTYHVLKGCYAFRIGNRNLMDVVTFQFSLSGHIVTSVETVDIDQQYWPEKSFEPAEKWKERQEGHLSEVFCVKGEDDVVIDLRISQPENETLYLHLRGVKLKNPYE